MEATDPSREETAGQSLAALLLLGALVATVLLSVPWDAEPGWWDASRHAMDGAFYMDMAKQGGWTRPVAYAQEYYARYPAIAPVLYPPMFGVAEAVLFAPFGPHPWVARLAVALFLLWGAWGVRRLACDAGGALAGLAAGALYVTAPLVFQWSREIMLEAPAAAFVIWSFVYCRRFLDVRRTRDLLFCLVCAVLGVYTKQNAVFVFPAILFAALFSGHARVLAQRRTWIGVACAAVAGIPLAYVTLRWGRMNLDQAVGSLPIGNHTLLGHVVYHLRVLPETVGWPVLPLALAGIVVFARSKKLDKSVLLSWMATCYVMMAIVRIKDPRQGFFWIPAIAILAGLGLAAIARMVPRPGLRPVLVGGAAAALMAVQAVGAPMNWCEGFDAVAKDIRDRWEGAALLVSVEHDGNLILRLRALDPDHELRVCRSEKVFEGMFVYKSWGVDEKVHSEEEICDAMARYGMRYALVEDDIRQETNVERMLRSCVRSDRFQEAATYDVRYPGNRTRRLVLYRFQGALDDPPQAPTVYLPIVGMEFQK